MRILLLLVLAAGLGCGQRATPDLRGTWKSVEGGDYSVLLELREDMTFERTGELSGLTEYAFGTYDVTPSKLTLRIAVERLGNTQPVDRDLVMSIPYEIQDQALVLYAGSNREQRFLLIR